MTVEYINTYTEIYDLPPTKAAKPETYSKSVQTTMVSTGTQGEDFDDDAPGQDGVAGHETQSEMQTRMIAQIDEERRQLEREIKELKAKADIVSLQRE